MDRTEVKLENSKKNSVISYAHNEISKNFTGSGFEEAPKLFSRDCFHDKTMRHSKFQLGQFFVH